MLFCSRFKRLFILITVYQLWEDEQMNLSWVFFYMWEEILSSTENAEFYLRITPSDNISQQIWVGCWWNGTITGLRGCSPLFCSAFIFT